MDEKLKAKMIAHQVLDDPGRDPDDDLAVLSRQLLRAFERLEPVAIAPSHDPAVTRRGADVRARLLEPKTITSLHRTEEKP